MLATIKKLPVAAGIERLWPMGAALPATSAAIEPGPVAQGTLSAPLSEGRLAACHTQYPNLLDAVEGPPSDEADNAAKLCVLWGDQHQRATNIPLDFADQVLQRMILHAAQDPAAWMKHVAVTSTSWMSSTASHALPINLADAIAHADLSTLTAIDVLDAHVPESVFGSSDYATVMLMVPLFTRRVGTRELILRLCPKTVRFIDPAPSQTLGRQSTTLDLFATTWIFFLPSKFTKSFGRQQALSGNLRRVVHVWTVRAGELGVPDAHALWRTLLPIRYPSRNDDRAVEKFDYVVHFIDPIPVSGGWTHSRTGRLGQAAEVSYLHSYFHPRSTGFRRTPPTESILTVVARWLAYHMRSGDLPSADSQVEVTITLVEVQRLLPPGVPVSEAAWRRAIGDAVLNLAQVKEELLPLALAAVRFLSSDEYEQEVGKKQMLLETVRPVL